MVRQTGFVFCFFGVPKEKNGKSRKQKITLLLFKNPICRHSLILILLLLLFEFLPLQSLNLLQFSFHFLLECLLLCNSLLFELLLLLLQIDSIDLGCLCIDYLIFLGGRLLRRLFVLLSGSCHIAGFILFWIDRNSLVQNQIADFIFQFYLVLALALNF